MADFRRRVERVIETDPVIKKGLQRGIVNSRALARHIQRTAVPESTLDSILGIIRRYPLESEEKNDLRPIFRECEFVMRNKIADLALENGPEIMKRIAEFAGSIRSNRGENLRVVVGLKSIRVIADQKALESFRHTLAPNEIIRYSTNLAEISLLLPPEAIQTKGIFARITTELALNDVNLEGMMCCAPEDILLVAEKDGPKALETLQKLLKEKPQDRPSNKPSRELVKARNSASLRKIHSGSIGHGPSAVTGDFGA